MPVFYKGPGIGLILPYLSPYEYCRMNSSGPVRYRWDGGGVDSQIQPRSPRTTETRPKRFPRNYCYTYCCFVGSGWWMYRYGRQKAPFFLTYTLFGVIQMKAHYRTGAIYILRSIFYLSVSLRSVVFEK